MFLTKIMHESNSGGVTGANQYATELWSGELGEKKFEVTLNSCAAPVWSGDELDSEERVEVMNELAERSSM